MPLVHLHGLATAGAVPCRDAPTHQLLACGPITAITSAFPAATAFENQSPDELGAWALNHNALLLAYCSQTTVLPIALGAVFSSNAAIETEVGMKTADHLAALNALKGIKEFTLRLSVTTAPPPATTTPETGRDFLKARRLVRDKRQDLQHAQQRMARRTLYRLQDIALQIQPAAAPRPERLLDCVALINEIDVPALHGISRDLLSDQTALGLKLGITGPWPPYSFDTTALPVVRNAS